MDVRLSRTSSVERGKEREEAWSFDGASENKRTVAKESEENKENLVLNSELKDDLLVYQDGEALNDSVISGEERVGPAVWGRPARRRTPGAGMEPGLLGALLPWHGVGTRPRACIWEYGRGSSEEEQRTHTDRPRVQIRRCPGQPLLFR